MTTDENRPAPGRFLFVNKALISFRYSHAIDMSVLRFKFRPAIPLLSSAVLPTAIAVCLRHVFGFNPENWRGGILIAMILATWFYRERIAKWLQIQAYRNETSWVYYFLVSLASTPILLWCVEYGLQVIHNAKEQGNDWSCGSTICDLAKTAPTWFQAFCTTEFFSPYFFATGLAFFLFGFYALGHNGITFSQKKIAPPGPFAPGSMGLENDKLDFSASAKIEAQKILALREPLTVAMLQGPQGSGKSSYLRMIVESLTDNKEGQDILYSYISLTETNADDDFTRLFAERWRDTIAERYPLIKHPVPWMESVFRDTDQSWAVGIARFIYHLNLPLAKTPKYPPEAQGYIKNGLELFSGVPKFHENLWTIVIDEVERAKIDEIYRAIETVERLRYSIEKYDTPLRIVVVFCIADGNLLSRLNKVKEQSADVAPLISDFFFTNPKQINIPIFLPTANTEKLVLHLFNSFNQRFSKVKVYASKADDLRYYVDLNQYRPNEQEAEEAILNHITKLKPRNIARCFEGINYWYSNPSLISSDSNLNYICFADIAGLTLLSIQYPYVIEFFRNTAAGKLDIGWYFGEENKLSDESKIVASLKKRIKEHSSFSGNPEDIPDEAINILRFVANQYFVAYAKYRNALGDDQVSLEHRTSLVENLRTYLDGYHKNHEGGSVRKEIHILHKHLAKIDSLDTIIPVAEDLLQYARFISQDRAKEITLGVLRTTAEALIRGMAGEGIIIEPEAPGPGDLRYGDAALRVLFLIVQIVNKFDDTTTAYRLFRDFMGNTKIKNYGKFLFLNGFINDERGADSQVNQEIRGVFKKIEKGRKEELQRIIRTFRDDFEANRRSLHMFLGDEKPIYVAYQSVDHENKSEQEKNIVRYKLNKNRISEVLSKHDVFIDLVWGELPDSPSAPRTGPDHFPRRSCRHLSYWLRLTDLVKISRERPNLKTSSVKIENWGKLSEQEFEEFCQNEPQNEDDKIFGTLWRSISKYLGDQGNP